MSATLITYLWHYLAARAIYEDLLRPLGHGDAAPLLAVGLTAAIAFTLGRLSVTRRRR